MGLEILIQLKLDETGICAALVHAHAIDPWSNMVGHGICRFLLGSNSSVTMAESSWYQ